MAKDMVGRVPPLDLPPPSPQNVRETRDVPQNGAIWGLKNPRYPTPLFQRLRECEGDLHGGEERRGEPVTRDGYSNDEHFPTREARPSRRAEVPGICAEET